MRPPGSFTAIFRNWDPAKFLIFVGDSTSSDIGLLGCTADPSGPHSESWTNFSLEETSTPTVPLDRDMNDTVLLGLSLDLTGTQTYNHKTASGEDSELPPPPVMYAYASDGTLVGWHILNLKGTPYPGMISASAPALATQQSSSIEMQASTEAVIKSPALSSGQPTTQPSSVFGQSSSLTAPSAFGQPPAPSAFGQNSFGQPSGFGAFSQSGTGGAFGQPSSLGATSTPSPFSTTPGSGFGAFASNEPSKFGQPTTGFGFGTGSGLGTLAPSTSNQPLASPMTLSMSASEEPMAAEADAGLGGLSLGGSSIGPGEAKPGFGTSGMFGTLAPAPADAAKTSTPAFGSATPFGGAIKPASGFGAFGNTGPSAFGQTSFGNPSIASTGSGSISTAPQTSSASPAFGAVGFGSATPSSAFGQSGFGQTSFGKSGFGQPAFGQSSLGSTPTTSAFGGGSGFSAFAQSGVSAFGTAANSGGAQAKPIWATSGNSTPVSEETKKTESVPSSSTFSAQSTPSAVGGFGGTIAPAFGATATPVKSEPSQESTTPASPPPKPANTTPDSSPFKSTGQAPATGAFANLTTSPGFGKFDSGFGAFGGASFSASSPFANPKPSVSSPFASTGSSTTSIFASSSSASPTKTGTGVAFGSTSALGSFGKSSTPVSAFPVPTPPTPGGIFGKSGFGDSLVGGASTTPPSTTKSGGFGAFASSSGGFASFAGGGTKTFSDLLKSSKDGDDDETDKGKERAQVEEKKAPVSVFSKLPPLPAKIEVPESPESVKSKGTIDTFILFDQY